MSPLLLDEFRGQFPVTRERTYLITGAIAPASDPVRRAVEKWLERLTHDPMLNFETWAGSTGELRRRFAGLIGAEPESIVVTDGTSRGAAIAVDLLAQTAGSTVLVDPTTYPSSRQPWEARTRKRLITSPVELDAEAVAHLGASDLAAVVISHVDWRTGYRHDIRTLADAAHAQGALLMVDAAQSTGAVPIDVRQEGIDVLVTSAMKWLYGVPGVGFLYIRPGLIEMPGAVAGSLEPGVPALPSIAATNAALELLEKVSVQRLATHIEALVTRCLTGLTDRGPAVLTPLETGRRAGVISIAHQRAGDLAARLRTQRIDVMGRNEWDFMRVDPAGFTTDDDIDRFLDTVGHYAPNVGPA